MNLARAMAMVVLGIAGLLMGWTGIESLELANGAACRGNGQSFVKVLGPPSTDPVPDTSYMVAPASPAPASPTPTPCVVEGAVPAFTTGWEWTALGEDVVVTETGPPWESWGLSYTDTEGTHAYEWDADGYKIATDSLAGRIFVGAQFGMMGSLLLLVFMAALTFRELTSAWF